LDAIGRVTQIHTKICLTQPTKPFETDIMDIAVKYNLSGTVGEQGQGLISITGILKLQIVTSGRGPGTP